jgi:hypothetical protein
MMPRRKKKWMLLRGRSGSFIVVERRWYDYAEIAKIRGERKSWWIVAESNDHGAMHKMAELTDKYLRMEVNHETEIITAERVTNVSDVVFKWELNCKQERN